MRKNKWHLGKAITFLSGTFLLVQAMTCEKTGPTGNTGSTDSSTFALTITASNGTIAKTPDKAKFKLGEVVTLIANANSGYTFSGWGGDASGTNLTITITMTGNKNVTAYFTGSVPETVTDISGNVYTTVKIGNQVWTVENLRTTKFNDGTAIPRVTDNAAWADLQTPGYCYYDNATNGDSTRKWGALYNWFAVNTRKLAPAGWHVPDTADWNILKAYLITNGYGWDGTPTDDRIGKSLAATTDWNASSAPEDEICSNLSKNNKSGFSALPGGCRIGGDGTFADLRYFGYWWCSTVTSLPCYYYLWYGNGYLSRYNFDKRTGLSVRLVLD
jgi:uncharacterized protein (TIGR02145 family)/uncharacterized repeat protein (TIGR02543 family)